MGLLTGACISTCLLKALWPDGCIVMPSRRGFVHHLPYTDYKRYANESDAERASDACRRIVQGCEDAIVELRRKK